jgi:starch synthase (maltosyl-transferring)
LFRKAEDRLQAGPRIYNLFPLLAGDIAGWKGHLARIAAMGFDWVYLNPFHYPGFSGSLYAVKDYYALNPLFRGSSREPADDLLQGFTEAARHSGLKVMMDLVVNHTSKDSLLVKQHPAWFAYNQDGSLRSPRAADASAPGGFVEWGDLAQLDFHDESTHPGLIAFFRDMAIHFARLGFAGFRCDAAYQVPETLWAGVIDGVMDAEPHVVFAAETLGCTPAQVAAIGEAGFDDLFNSAKWWDFRAPWFFEQYDLLRRIAPSIAFPESHDTERLINELPAGAEPEVYYRQRLLLAIFASAGWLMPIGFEFGFAKRLDVVSTRNADWETPRFDLSPLIAKANAAKAAVPALNEEGRIERLTAPEAPVVALRRYDRAEAGWVALAVNTDWRGRHRFDAARLLGGGCEDITPRPDGMRADAAVLGPGEARLLRPSRATLGGQRSAELPQTISRAIVIEDVQPQIDCGRYPVKREVGDMVEVSADIFTDGHDRLAATILYREKDASHWDEARMSSQDNDHWTGRFSLMRNTRYVFTIDAWVDAFESWREGTLKKRQAGQDVALELVEGRRLVEQAVNRAEAEERSRLERTLDDLGRDSNEEKAAALLLSTMLRQVMALCPDRSRAVRYDRVLEVTADRVAARFAAWYEMFPRSQGSDPTRSATFADCAARLPEIAGMGFDVVYLVPIHPIGRVHRKGPDNSLNAAPGDPGSPYAIGSAEGGHNAVHAELGTLDDFRAFIRRAGELGMEVALDFAIQCAPDHPWVKEHPEWFRFRPDGTIRYAENPPKKYQDIVNVDFWNPDARGVWDEILLVVLFWVDQGVKTFRVDNPHTKPVPFWEWLIGTVQARHPEVIFLSEAFTRPKMMKMLAKVGFTQSYTYFTWRNFKNELVGYMMELTRSEMRQYYRPNFFTNTPDILPAFLQTGGRPAFVIRLVLAATLSSLYGIYNGYELCEAAAVPNSEEYLHSEKYQYKVWDWNRPGHIKHEISRINAIRRDNPALHEFENLVFYQADDDSVLFYGKATLDRSNLIFVAINLDPFDAHQADLHFPLAEMGVPEGETFEVEELLEGGRHLWRGPVHSVRLDPHINPVVIFRVTVWRSVAWREPCL